MSHHHYTPGRIRFKHPGLKDQPRLAAMVEQAIRRLNGVKMVHVNAVTGSQLIHYDVRGEREKELLRAVYDINHHFGLTSESQEAVTGQSNSSRSPAAPAHGLVDALLDALVKKAIESAAVALVGALI